jgi:hypothetical protein
MRRHRLQIHPLRAFFWSAVLLLGLMLLLQRHPPQLEAGDPLIGGRWLDLPGRSDLLVVLSPPAMQERSTPDRPDAGWAWVDMFRQEVGPVSVQPAEAWDRDEILRHRVVVFTASALQSARAEGVGALVEALCERGAVTVLELPNGELRQRWGSDGQGGWRNPGAVTAIEGVEGPEADALRRMPILTRFLGSTRAVADAETLLAFDGAPVVYARLCGAGQVIVVEFDFGAQIAAMQQGLPRRDGRVRRRASDQPAFTGDLIATSAMTRAEFPWADLLERWMVHGVVGRHMAIFSLWPWPDGAHGGLLTSHQSSQLQGRPLWMSIHERSLQARSTTFLSAPGPGAPRTVDVPEFIGHAALLWHLDPEREGLFRSWGLGGLEVMRQPLTLVGQAEKLQALLGREGDIRGVRTADGRWTDAWLEGWAAMDAMDLRYSVSFGPRFGEGGGWSFGTCQPFWPRDAVGLPFRTQEIPVCFADPTTEEEVEALQSALDRASRHHYSVHLLTSADRFDYSPSMAGFDAWRDALQTAQTKQMWVGGAGELLTFWRRRSSAEVRLAARQIAQRDSDGQPRTVDYTVEVETSDRGLVLMVPVRSEGLTLLRVTRGSRESQLLGDQVTTREMMWLGRPVQLVNLNPGYTTLGLRYGR